jgi:PPOX class probable FMN-dependent enzyme
MRRFVAHAPLCVIASVGAGGALADASPRGGLPGFVQLADARTLLIPDATGNNRLDTLENLLADPRIGLLFLVPGVDEVLRVNGTARLRDEPGFIDRFAAEGVKPPRLVIEVAVREAYLHCPKALLRARLWWPEARVAPGSFPSMNAMLRAQLGSAVVTETDEQARRATAPSWPTRGWPITCVEWGLPCMTTTLILGASRGIGLELARQYAGRRRARDRHRARRRRPGAAARHGRAGAAAGRGRCRPASAVWPGSSTASSSTPPGTWPASCAPRRRPPAAHARPSSTA